MQPYTSPTEPLQVCNDNPPASSSNHTAPHESLDNQAPPSEDFPTPSVPTAMLQTSSGASTVAELALRFLSNSSNKQTTSSSCRTTMQPMPPSSLQEGPRHGARRQNNTARNARSPPGGCSPRVGAPLARNHPSASSCVIPSCASPSVHRPPYDHAVRHSPSAPRSPVFSSTTQCSTPSCSPGRGRRSVPTTVSAASPLGSVEWGPSRRVPVPPSIVPNNTAILVPAVRQRFALSNAHRSPLVRCCNMMAEDRKRIADALPRAERRLLPRYEVPQWITERIDWMLLSQHLSSSPTTSSVEGASCPMSLRLHHLPAVSCIVVVQLAIRTAMARRVVEAKRAARTLRLHHFQLTPRAARALEEVKSDEAQDANSPVVFSPPDANTPKSSAFHRTWTASIALPPRISVSAVMALPTMMIASNRFLPDAHQHRRLSGFVTKASATYRQRKRSMQATTVDDSIIKENAAFTLHRFFVVGALKWKLKTRMKRRLEEYLSDMVLDEHVRVLHAFLECKRSNVVFSYKLRLQLRRHAASVIQRYYRAYACRQAYYWQLVELRRRTNVRVALDQQRDACRVLISVLQMLRARSIVQTRKKLLVMKMQYREEAEKRERTQDLMSRLSSLLTSMVRKKKRAAQVALLVKKRVAKEKQDERRVRLHEAVPIVQSALLQRRALLVRKQKQQTVVAVLTSQLRGKMQLVHRTVNEATAKAMFVRVHEVMMRFFVLCPAMWKRRMQKRVIDEQCAQRIAQEALEDDDDDDD